MTKRGKILRDTAAGTGLLAVEGGQYSFQLEGVWRSEEPPRIGMVVEVAFNHDNAVEWVRGVPESVLAKEQAEQALRKGSLLASQIKAKVGLPTLIAFGVLLVGWFFLSSIDIGKETVGVQITFWELLGYVGKLDAIQGLNPYALAHNGMGIYSLLGFASLAGPFLFYFWKDRRAALGGLLPLAVMVVAAVLVLHGLHHLARQAAGFADLFGESAAGKKMMDEATDAFMSQFQIGVGAYVSLASACYFAYAGVRRYLAAEA
jgi:hypothetical protein